MKKLLITLGILFFNLCVHAQNFPNHNIQVVVPVAAGGGTDLLARNLSQRVSEILGQTLVVENKLGAGGNIGVEYVMKSKADGYTLLISPATIATNVAVYKKIPYDLVKDLQAITLIGQTGVVLVVHPSVKANNLKEFIELMKSKNGDMNYGSAGMGSPQHLQAEFFNQLVGLKSNHIPYKGQAQAMNDLIGGQLNYMLQPHSKCFATNSTRQTQGLGRCVSRQAQSHAASAHLERARLQRG